VNPDPASAATTPPVTLADLVRRDLVRCGPDQDLGAAVRVMRRAGVSAVLVEEPDGRPVGIWTERDILRLDLADPAQRHNRCGHT